MEGYSPNHRTYQHSDSGQVYVFNFEDLDGAREAMLRIGEAEIGSSVTKYFYLTMAVLMTTSANEFWDLWPTVRKEAPIAVVVHLATQSPRELAYEEKLLFEIAEETRGHRVPAVIEDWFRCHMDFFMVVGSLQRVLRLGGGWMPTKLGADSVTHMFEVGKTIPEFINTFIDNGTLFDAPDNFQIAQIEYGHFAYIELLFMFDRTNPAVGPGVGAFLKASRETDLAHHNHAETVGTLNAGTELLGPLFCNYHVWLRKLKEAVDPNNVGNPMR